MLGTHVAISDTACDLGVVIDRELSLAAHFTALCCSSYNQLRQLRPVVHSLSVNATKMLVQAFISCHLDYCNFDCVDPSNYRPVSNLNNIFKLLECLFLSHFQSYVCAFNNFSSVQSAYRRHYSAETETALLQWILSIIIIIIIRDVKLDFFP